MDGLSTRQSAAIRALVTGATQADAASAAGVTERTIRRYLGEPVFVLALRQAQDVALGGVTRKMASGASDALDVLMVVMADEYVPAAVRVRAALGWLNTLWKARELADLAERITALEREIENESQG